MNGKDLISWRHESSRRRRQVIKILLLAVVSGLGCGGVYLGTIRGLVKLDGVPAAGVTVALTDDENSEAQHTVTDADGKYEFEASNGNHDVQVVHNASVECVPDTREVNVKQDETTEVNFDCATLFAATVTAGYNHTQPGVESVECKRITTSPPMPGATYTLTVVGPIEGGNSGVIPGQGPFTGTLDAQGTARIQVRINRFGTYRNTVTVKSGGNVERSGVIDVPVGSPASSCP